MVSWVDWKIRVYAQNLLDWSGRRFGLTREPWIRNAFCIFSIIIAWGLFDNFSWISVFGGFIAIVFNGLLIYIFLENLKKTEGEYANWIQGEWIRRFNIYFLFFEAFLFGLLIVSGSWSALARLIIGRLAIWVMYYIPTCMEAPPKEQAKKLAYAAS